jgi:DNA-binding LacI/PurR family transcriptional regulator
MDAYHAFVQYGVDGMVILSHNYLNLNNDNLSLPNIDRVIFLEKPNTQGACYVDIDFAGAIESGVRHLIETGRKRLGLIIPDIKSSTIVMRQQGFERGVAAAGNQLECGLVHVFGDLSPSLEEFEQQYQTFIAPNGLDGLILLEDNRAAGMIRICRKHGKRVPEDISLIGFGNALFGHFTEPSLTTFSVDTNKTGCELVRLLLQLIKNANPTKIQPSVVLPKLIVRESTYYK